MSKVPVLHRWSVERGGSEPPDDVLSHIWRAASYRNPFCGPAFHRVMGATGEQKGLHAATVIGWTAQDEPVAMWPLAQDRHGRIRFLPHEYCDQCTVLAAPQLDAHALSGGLVTAIEETKPSGLSLTNVPPWGMTFDAATQALDRIGWFQTLVSAKPCPVVRTASGADLTREFDRHRSPRRYWNRLQKTHSAVFELLTDDSELDDWCEGFCDAHQWRWSGTATPSQYEDPTARLLFRDVVEAWLRDGALLRFATRLESGRAAYAVVLRAGTRLIYHHLALSPIAGTETRAGTVLMWLTGRWAGDSGFTTFDFGYGGESYKYRYANDDERLWRIYGAPSRYAPLHARAIIERRIRSTPALWWLWDRIINRYIRSPWRNAVRSLRRRGKGGTRTP